MFLTHSSILTSGYNNTTQTVNYLISGIGALRAAYSAIDEIGLQYSRCDTGNFHLKGYYGDTANDLLKHLYAMNIILGSALDILYNQTTGLNGVDLNNYNFTLDQNYPNPFNPSTIISWQSPTGSWQTLQVYDILGNEVATLVDEYKLAGKYEVEFNPSSSIKNLASGIYFYRIQAGCFAQTKKMMVLK